MFGRIAGFQHGDDYDYGTGTFGAYQQRLHPQGFDEYGSGRNESDNARNEMTASLFPESIDHLSAATSSLSLEANNPLQMKNERVEKSRQMAKEFGINLSKPKYPQFAILSVRLKTFKNWPFYMQQRPEILAEAGFFYSGTDDTVFCFYCGLGLREWEPEDTPWGEHARWSSECAFVINMKGREFLMVEKLKDTNPEEYVARKRELEMSEQPVETDTDTDDLTSPAALSLIQNGYTDKMVRKAIYIFCKDNGGLHSYSATDLLNIVFDLEEGNIECEDFEKSEKDSEEEAVKKENRELKKTTYCRKCSAGIVSVVFLPCGHLCSCNDCAPSIKYCLICNGFIKGTVRTYLV